MTTKNVLGKFSYFFVIASVVAGVAFASQIPATASTSAGWTANRMAKDVVTGISFAAGGVAGGATIPAVTVVTGSSTAGWAAGGVAGGTAGGAVKQVGDYAVDHPAKAVAKTAPIVAVLYAPIVPGAGFALTAIGVAKNLARWIRK
ncbi:MAG TPA: hypothetical protein VF307_06140 [Candidatus Nanopelagicaceae bacterium]